MTLPTQEILNAAYAATRAVARETPLLQSEPLTKMTGATALFVKAEGLQKAGSFKLRGAYWRLCGLSAEERQRGVVAYSSGNFAQGLALAGRELGVPVTIVMPADAPEMKRRATEGFGAKVVLSHHGDRPREEAASALAIQLAGEQGLVLLHPFDDPAIVAGQAGAALEAIAQIGAAPDVLVAPVGGGGLMGGAALALRAANPRAEIWAAEPEGYDGMGRSLAAGERVKVPGGATICDALQATMPGEAPFAACQAAGVRGLAVTDAEVARAMRTAFDELKLVLEPSGAVALAAVLAGRVPVAGKTVLVVASGSNIPFARFSELVDKTKELVA
ncbi:threonine/serine dehydratase [Xinfangfangia sp. CPCC 101601]|uniref:Threonine/serine dehydratase n=1 Tax=Pseudogemmobacter lacusdianii TaxID=3069608 RepID=A0ABU0VT79_9RHOB|nr:threonine/serine dehydratase [Xinfangfangia sp. CPCC 101601]MDQ2064924.1 threonine/serine dehydratase [Xinfangfangia sp. CPCC 101601]